ncbi:MAG: MmgE/PrpD family protein [Betaproteobacteria bacterium]|nr:MmgE/PrpD family protein [Betaproteobacteria bacterium]
MTVTSACADFTIGLDLESVPAEAVKWAKWGLLDCTGVAVAGAATELSRIVNDYLKFVGGRRQARVIGLGTAASAPEAAMANGALAHALDFDDVGGFGHPTAVLAPVIYALADLVKPSGKEALTAYVAGYEVGNCLADRNTFGKIDTKSWHLGWHPTGPYGAIAATCTAARLLKLTREQTMHALGIAASEASGIQKNFGTMTKPLHAGIAARNGVFAALLAQRGFTADADALGGEQGFLRAFKGPGDYTEELVCAKLGKTYALSRGLVIKWYPACWSTHRATSGVIELVKEHALRPDDIASIEVDLRLIPLLHTNPSTGLQGKFSMAFNLALGVLEGWSEIPDYTARRTQQANLRAIMQKVHHVQDPADGTVNVTIVTKNGQRLAKNLQHAPGDPSFGLQEERTLKKFRACAAYRLPTRAIATVEKTLLNLEQAPDLTRLMNALTTVAAKPRSVVPA